MAKISIQQAASALAKKGYRLLGPGPYDLKAKSASYRVVDPSGHTAVLTQEQVKELMSTPALKRARALSLAKRRLSLAASTPAAATSASAHVKTIDQLISKLQQNPARRDLDRGAPFIRLAIATLGEAKQHLNDLIEEYSNLP